MIAAAFAFPAVADLSGRTKLRFVGADRVRFLNGQVSNDVRLATETASIYSCVMTIKGKMCADAFIHSGGDALWLDTEPEVRETLAARLEKYIIADDVALEDASDEMGLLHLFPCADEPGSAGEALSLAAKAAGLRGVRSWRYGQPGLDFWGAPDMIATARDHLLSSWPLLDNDAIERRRNLAGVPKWGAELDENTMPAEAGLEARAVSYVKGCYIGQEVVSRVRSVGHVNRQLRGLRCMEPDALTAGWSLFPRVENGGSREIGRVTSVAPPSGGAAGSIALAFVRRGWETAGTVLAARPPGPVQGSVSVELEPAAPGLSAAGCQAAVCELPFT